MGKKGSSGSNKTTKRLRVIHSEEEAWSLLNDLGTAKLKAQDVELKFKNFPNIEFKFKGDQPDGSLNSRVMNALIKIQDDLHKSFALAAYGDEKHRLSEDEKSKLEISFKVGEGSTIVDAIDLANVMNTFVKEAAQHVTGHDIIILASIFGVSLVSWRTVGKYFDQKGKAASSQIAADERNKRDEQETIRITTQQKAETERLGIIEKIVKKDPRAELILEKQFRTIESISKSVKTGEEVVLPDGYEMTEIVAKEIFQPKPRRTPEMIEVIDVFAIHGVVNRSGELKIELRDRKGKTHTAVFSGDDDAYAKLSAAVRRHRELPLMIKAKDFEGEMSEIEVLDVATTKGKSKPELDL